MRNERRWYDNRCAPSKTQSASNVWREERSGVLRSMPGHSSPSTLARLRLAADIGGTFTDVAAFDQTNKRLLLGKSLSTPRAMVDGIEAGVAKAGTKFSEAGLFLHGSTVAINTMLERTGAKT